MKSSKCVNGTKIATPGLEIDSTLLLSSVTEKSQSVSAEARCCPPWPPGYIYFCQVQDTVKCCVHHQSSSLSGLCRERPLGKQHQDPGLADYLQHQEDNTEIDYLALVGLSYSQALEARPSQGLRTSQAQGRLPGNRVEALFTAKRDFKLKFHGYRPLMLGTNVLMIAKLLLSITIAAKRARHINHCCMGSRGHPGVKLCGLLNRPVCCVHHSTNYTC